MATVSKRRVVAMLALTLLLLTAVYAWGPDQGSRAPGLKNPTASARA